VSGSQRSITATHKETKMSNTQLAAAEEVAPLKDIQRFIWSQGDYSAIARETTPAAEALVSALDVRPGVSLVDVAAGDGNLAILAAQRGAAVAAIDIAPQMVELGQARCAAEGLTVKWSEGDAEDLPFVSHSFDRAGSVFGAMFAPRPEQTASELHRVVRPGGLVGLASWTPEGFIGRWVAAIVSYMPPSGVELPPATLWGVEQAARERLEPYAEEITIERRSLPFVYSSVEEMLTFHERCNGPVVAARALLRDRYPQLRDDLRQLIAEFSVREDGSVEIHSEYLIVTARIAETGA
jgi:ubiquinone/menaquinone biosynthesis C-methylase UbiE